MIIAVIMASALAFFVILSYPVTAQDDELLRLHQKILDLETRIKDLENLIQIPEGPEKFQLKTGPGWQNKKNWRNLQTGMTRDQVYTLLGEPIKTINGVRTLWYYPNIYCGYVSFDEKGCLTGWNEP
jgi:SmpA/OmlA family protein